MMMELVVFIIDDLKHGRDVTGHTMKALLLSTAESSFHDSRRFASSRRFLSCIKRSVVSLAGLNYGNMVRAGGETGLTIGPLKS